MRKGTLSCDAWRGCASLGSSSSQKLRADINADADPDHALYGQSIVFTGTLLSMTRQEAWDKVASLGADPDDAVTTRTTILVQGHLRHPERSEGSRPGEALSSKARKVNELLKKGQQIEIMTEVDFLRSL